MNLAVLGVDSMFIDLAMRKCVTAKKLTGLFNAYEPFTVVNSKLIAKLDAYNCGRVLSFLYANVALYLIKTSNTTECGLWNNTKRQKQIKNITLKQNQSSWTFPKGGGIITVQ